MNSYNKLKLTPLNWPKPYQRSLFSWEIHFNIQFSDTQLLDASCLEDLQERLIDRMNFVIINYSNWRQSRGSKNYIDNLFNMARKDALTKDVNLRFVQKLELRVAPDDRATISIFSVGTPLDICALPALDTMFAYLRENVGKIETIQGQKQERWFGLSKWVQ